MISSQQLDATFAALADPTRRAILARLATGEASVSELAEPFDMSQPAISKHLKVLERAGLITSAREAQRRPRRMEPAPLAEAAEWIERYRRIWEGNYQRLDALLGELQRTGARGPVTGAHRDRSAARARRQRPVTGPVANRSTRKTTTSKTATKRRGGKGK
jgi:DNA-binding transcriptional ArsR family regulator